MKYNEIEDISVLESLTNLEELDFRGNQVKDISALVKNKGLGEGTFIQLDNNPIDFSAGSENLGHLQELIDRGVNVDIEL